MRVSINRVLGIPRFNGKQNLIQAHFLVKRKFNLTKKDKYAFLKIIDFLQ